MSEVKGAAMELGTERIRKLLVQYAVPAIIAMTASSLYNMVDSIFIGHGVGALAISGLALTFPLMNLAAAFGSLVGVGAATLVSMRLGQRDYETAQRILGNVVVLNLIIGISFGLLTLVFLDPILYFFGASDATIGYAREYMSVILWGNVVTHMYLGLNAVLRAAGHPRKAMYATILTVTINAILDPLFIFVFHMGMAGAALATITGQILSFALVVFYLRGFKTLPLSLSDLKPKIACWARIAALGATPAFNQVAMMVVQIVMNNTLTHYGSNSVYGSDIPLACAGIISKVNMLFFSFVIGISQGLQPIVSFNFGAQKYDRVKDAYKKAVFAATAISIVAFLCFQLFPRQIIGIFGSGSEEYLHFAERYFRIFLFFTFLNGIQPVSSNFFTSIGAPKKGIFLSLTRQIIFLLPLLLIFPYLFGIDGVMYTAPIADLAAASVSIVMVVREFKIMAELQKATA